MFWIGEWVLNGMMKSSLIVSQFTTCAIMPKREQNDATRTVYPYVYSPIIDVGNFLQGHFLVPLTSPEGKFHYD